jgi:hypothetical protein
MNHTVVQKDQYYQMLSLFRLGRTCSDVSRELGLDSDLVERIYKSGTQNPPRASIFAVIAEEQRIARELAMNMIREKNGLPQERLSEMPPELNLAEEFDIEEEKMKLVRHSIRHSNTENHAKEIHETAEIIAETVEDRLGSIKYVRALKAVLSQQAPTIKKAMTTIETAIGDIANELPKLNTMQKLNVVSKLSGYIETWQGSVEAAIRLERLLMGEPDSHVAVTEMSQEDALKRLDRLRNLAAQANARILEAEERRTP